MSCLRARYDLEISENADFRMVYRWHLGKPPNDTPVDLTGYTAEMHIRRTRQGGALIECTTENGRIVVANQDTDRGRYDLVIPAAVTRGLCVNHQPVRAVYDMVLIDAQGMRQMQHEGRVTIIPATTRDW